jgi:hypothetical protein
MSDSQNKQRPRAGAGMQGPGILTWTAVESCEHGPNRLNDPSHRVLALLGWPGHAKAGLAWMERCATSTCC